MGGKGGGGEGGQGVLHLHLNSLQFSTSSSGPIGSCHSHQTFSASMSLLLSVMVLMQPEALISSSRDFTSLAFALRCLLPQGFFPDKTSKTLSSFLN